MDEETIEKLIARDIQQITLDKEGERWELKATFDNGYQHTVTLSDEVIRRLIRLAGK